MAAPAQVANVLELRWRVTELGRELGEKKLQLQTILGLATEKATLRSKGEMMRTVTTHLQSENDVVLMLMDAIKAFCEKTKGVVTAVTNLKQREPDLESKLR